MINLRPIRPTRPILLCVLAVACDSGTEPDPTPIVDRIVVEPSSFVLEVGETLGFTATPQDAAGQPVTGHTVTWSTSDAAVATVSASGTVTGIGRGPVTITAAVRDRLGTASGEIEPSMTMTEAGGTLTSADGRATLVFPAGAVSEPVRISIEPSTGLPAEPRLVAGSAYRFGPTGLQFAVPVQLTIGYSELSALPAGAGRYLALHRWTDNQWQAAATIVADTLAGTVSGMLSGFSNYGAALSEFLEPLEELSATLNRVLGDPVVHDALAVINLVAGLAAASDNPLHNALVEPALEAARVTTCNAYAAAIEQAMASNVDSYEEFTTQTGRVMVWHGIVAKLPDAGDCEPPATFDQVVEKLVTEFVAFTIARLGANDLATDYPKLLAELRLVLKLRTDATSLTLFDLDERLLSGAQQPLVERLRASAYAECRERRDHVHLGDLLETMSLLDQPSYEASDVLLDLQYCGTVVDWSLEKADGEQVTAGTLGGGIQPGTRVSTASAPGVAAGTLHLSNTLLAFRCRGGTFEQDVVTVSLNGTEVQTLPFNSGGNFLMQSTALDVASMLQAASIDPAESATHQLALTRASSGCSNAYVASPDPVTLATIDLQYPEAWSYENDFSDAAGAEWSARQVEISPSGQRFLGNFRNETITLTLEGLPPHSEITLEFDVYAIGSWDGNEPGSPETFTVGFAGGDVFKTTTFSHQSDKKQAYPGDYPGGDYPARTGSMANDVLGYSGPDMHRDSAYRLTFTRSHSANSVSFMFASGALDNTPNEFFGVDNVRVTVR